MTKAEEILEKHLKINDVETMLGRHGTTRKAVINALNEAINYTRCCETLKTKDRIAFHVFAEINKYTKCFEGYKRDGKTFSETEVLKRYNTYLLSL
tara:strand:+ start:9702 stop:9989 length:288 start_codon:yes stop_codon:yes gene_type:complete